MLGLMKSRKSWENMIAPEGRSEGQCLGGDLSRPIPPDSFWCPGLGEAPFLQV